MSFLKNKLKGHINSLPCITKKCKDKIKREKELEIKKKHQKLYDSSSKFLKTKRTSKSIHNSQYHTGIYNPKNFSNCNPYMNNVPRLSKVQHAYANTDSVLKSGNSPDNVNSSTFNSCEGFENYNNCKNIKRNLQNIKIFNIMIIIFGCCSFIIYIYFYIKYLIKSKKKY